MLFLCIKFKSLAYPYKFFDVFYGFLTVTINILNVAILTSLTDSSYEGYKQILLNFLTFEN